ncbi:Uu.00g083380.m01.CDS01 [Anthostomella pinea]|uniref:Uu.00g083380.m01.CDS01 n=1 Tax=Anthostomella pinea TaxID=933095 RepID=A0AAI8VM86_9PEZI|nr:Uu.00g083380.m01.CDS01 [Anthostomella pinea]
MHLFNIASFALLGLPLVASSPLQARDELQSLNDQAVAALQARCNTTGCNISNARVRRDWVAFSSNEKTDYISAMNCFMALPSIADTSFAPGARTRYDDFVAGNFLTWHRYFLSSFEAALAEECGYTDTQPYWNWLADHDSLQESAYFDGSNTSFGGDGYFVQHNGSLVSLGKVHIPSGTGGGCVTSGPFTDYVINLGPVTPTMDGLNASSSALAYNPHCMIRDLNSYVANEWLTLEKLLNITVGDASGSIALFQNELQGRFGDGFLGLHTAGHNTMGGTSGDLFASPVDPMFWLHHGMVDRVYWIWQALHLDQADTTAGTLTINNSPASRNTTVDDVVDLSVNVNAVPRPISSLLDTLSGDPFCYIYL